MFLVVLGGREAPGTRVRRYKRQSAETKVNRRVLNFVLLTVIGRLFISVIISSIY